MTNMTSAFSATAQNRTDDARTGSITLAELIPQMEATALRMSTKNPARRLLWIAAQVLMQQAKENFLLRARIDAASERRIVLP